MTLPEWTDDPTVQVILLNDLENYRESVEAIRKYAEANLDGSPNALFHQVEPDIIVPVSVRRLRKTDDELALAMRSRPVSMTKLFGGQPDQCYLSQLEATMTKLSATLTERIESIESGIRDDSELLNATLRLLTGGEQNVFQCLLKNKPGVSYETLADLEETWEENPPRDESIRRRLSRMNTKLSSSRYELHYGKRFVSRRAKLINHRKTESDNPVR